MPMTPKQPFVSCIITTYLSSTKPYLELAMKSANNLDYPKDRMEIILVTHKIDHALYKEMFANEYTRVICPPEDQFNNPRGMNLGIASASKEAEFFYMFNDDVIVTKDSLKNLVHAVGESPVIAHTITNCMNHKYYSLFIGIEKDGKMADFNRQYYRLPDIEGMSDHMMNSRSVYPSGAIYHQFLCLPAALFPKKLFETVGNFDEMFETGQDDICMCIRASRAGYGIATILNALAFHASGVTADKSVDIEKRIANIKYFYAKFGQWPPGMDSTTVDKLTEQGCLRNIEYGKK